MREAGHAGTGLQDVSGGGAGLRGGCGLTVRLPLLVSLPGTGGQPATGPRLFFEAALQQGYRVLAPSYLNTSAG